MNEPTTLHQLQNSGPAADFNTVMRRLAGGNDPTLSPTASISEALPDLLRTATLTPAEEAARAEREAAGIAAREASLRNQQGPLRVGASE